MLGAPVPMELYAWQSYPVYVYGCFKHNDNYLAENAALYINGKEKAIEWNGDASKGEYYITFGKLTDATTEKPSRYQRYNYNEVPKWEINTNDIETRIAKGEVTLASKDIAGSAQKNGLATTGADVNKYVKGKWSGLKPRKGAEGFPETGTKWSWHIDGTINVYRVYYKSDDIGEPVKLPKESTYFLDDYTVRKMETSSQNYKFLGWEYKGRVYQDKETIEAPGEDITLTAKWAPKEKVYTVNYNWGSNAPEGVTLPTDNTPYNSEIEAKNAMDTTYVNGYEHKTTDGTYTFSGWTPSVGTTDYNGDKIVTPITFTGTWNFTPKPVWKLAYSWTGDVPNGVENVVLPTNSDVYYSEQDAIQHKDNSYTADTSFNANNGIYTFSGWSETPTSNTTTVDGIKTTTLTFTGTWTFTPNPVWKLAYSWTGDVPNGVENVVLPTNSDVYYSEQDAIQHKDNSYTADTSFNANNGIYTFSGWSETPTSNTTTVDGIKTTTLTFTGTWTFTPNPVWKLAYSWTGDVPNGVENVVLPTNSDVYYSEQDAIQHKDNSYTADTSFNANNGIYTFSGWSETPTSNTTTVDGIKTTTLTFTGTWTFTPNPVWKLAYSWTGDVPNGVENVVLPANSDVYYSEQDAIQHKDNSYTADTSFNANNGIYTFSGWSETPTSNTTTVDGIKTTTLTYTGSWNFTPSEIKTITGVLNTLVWKSFTAQYNYSTEGTFTATAKVMPVHPEINSYAAEVDESSDNNTNTPGTDNAKTFTGTVNLKTGETRAFNFSAGKGVADVLDPDTYYEVRVSEVEGNLSKVTYDTTKYILTFTTDRNAVVDYIWIAKEKDSENDHPELEPVEGTTITFHNIYTYKRHHSSSDGGNGGGKKEEKPTVEIKDDDALGLNNTDHFAYIVGYGNGEVRPQNSITRAEVAAIFFRLLEDDVRDANYTRQNKFTDVSNDAWYCSAVSTLSAMGIISGYPDATFRPNASITRAEFAAIATRFDVNGDKTPASFNDIAGHWAKDEIAVAANNGWVNGYEDGSFRPQNKITRAETMSLVNRVLNRKPETAEDLLENMTKWTDNADTNAWYYLAVQEATNSHYYEYKENSQYEKWTELRETRDWSELDK